MLKNRNRRPNKNRRSLKSTPQSIQSQVFIGPNMASVAALKGDVKMGHERDEEEGKALQKPKWDWILDRNKGRSSTLEVQRVAKCEPFALVH